MKYLVKKTVTNLSAAEKKKVKAKIEAFDFLRMHDVYQACSFVKIYGSCVGRDFKLWAQISAFILDGIISGDELEHKCEHLFFLSSLRNIETWYFRGF